MATVVGQASAAATSVAIPAHAVGDLIIVAARGTAAAPVKPAAGGTVPAWDTIQSALANSVGLTTVAFVATATNHTTGVFTSATHICVLVLRPAALKKLQTAAARSSTGNGNNTQTIIYPALTLNNGGGASTSLGVRIGTRGVADSEVGTNIPSGWTNQSIQPAGAGALMAVHIRLALAANPTADSIATAGTNSAYRAHTVEVEEVNLGVDVFFAASVVGAGAVAVASTTIPPPITFAIDLATNQPYAGEHDAGEFLAGAEPLLALDLSIERIDFLDGLISGQATVGASLSVSRSLSVTVAGLGAVTATQSATRGVAASVAGTGAVTAQQGVTRAVAASIVGLGAVVADTFVGHTISFGCAVAGQAAVSADIIRVPVTADLASTVTGVGVVAPSLTVTNANFISLDATISGQGSLSVQSASQRSLAVAISGVGSLTTAQAPLRGFDASISRQAALVVQQDPIVATGGPVFFDATISRASSVAATPAVTRGLAVTVSRFGAVSVDITRVGAAVEFACSLGLPLAGQKLCGTFLVGSGPGATVEAQMGPVVVSLSANIARAATVTAAAEWERTFAPSLITGQSAISAQVLITRGLEASIVRTATVAIDGRVIRLVQFECEIKVIPHICGEYLAGQQVVGGTGPRATIEAYTTIRGPFAIAIQGNASVESLLRASTPLAAAITGQAFIETESRPSLPFSAVVGGRANVEAYHVTKLVLGNQIVGKAAIKAKLNLDWLVPTDPVGIILTPTDEEDLILVPTTNGSVTLVPTSPGSVTLVPTDEEDLLLVPTTERTM